MQLEEQCHKGQPSQIRVKPAVAAWRYGFSEANRVQIDPQPSQVGITRHVELEPTSMARCGLSCSSRRMLSQNRTPYQRQPPPG